MTQNAECKKATLQLTHQNIKVINGHFTTVSGHFFANYMKIFHKTEIQKVILKCSTSLKLIWYKIHYTKCKKTQKSPFFTRLQKNEMEIFASKLED